MKNFLLLVFTSTRHANIFCNTNLPSIREIYPIRIASSFDDVCFTNPTSGFKIIFRNSFNSNKFILIK